MPFESQAQKGFMFAHHPLIAKRWAKETPHMGDLPEYKKMNEGGEVCPTCGKPGYSHGGEVDEDVEEGGDQEQERMSAESRRKEFASILRRKGY